MENVCSSGTQHSLFIQIKNFKTLKNQFVLRWDEVKERKRYKKRNWFYATAEFNHDNGIFVAFYML